MYTFTICDNAFEIRVNIIFHTKIFNVELVLKVDKQYIF